MTATADIVRVMTDRCIDRSCEGGDSDSAQAASSEQCRDYYGPNRVDEWCDMCLFNEAIKRLSSSPPDGSSAQKNENDLARIGQAEQASAPQHASTNQKD